MIEPGKEGPQGAHDAKVIVAIIVGAVVVLALVSAALLLLS